MSRTADLWYVALTVEEERKAPPPRYVTVLGSDAGFALYATLSSGFPIPKPKFLLRRLHKLRRLSKAYSRKLPGSQNQRKAAHQLARFHRRIMNTRKDFQHKLSTYYVKNHDIIVIEDLHVKGLIRNKKQSRH